MGAENIVEVGAKGTTNWFLPSIKITIFFFIFFFIWGCMLWMQTGNVYYVFEKTIFKVTSADHMIVKQIQDIKTNNIEKPDHWYQCVFSKWLWNWIVFWFEIFSNIWFIYFFFYLLYLLFNSLNTSTPALTIGLAIAFGCILMMFSNVLLYHTTLSGETMPDSKMEILGQDLANSYPLHGVIKVIKETITLELFNKVGTFLETNPIAQSLTDIPNANVTGG